MTLSPQQFTLDRFIVLARVGGTERIKHLVQEQYNTLTPTTA